MRFVALVIVATAGCSVNSDFSATVFQCRNFVCPDGFSCIDEVCRASGAEIDASVASDAPPIDASGPPRCPASCELIAQTRLCFCRAEVSFEAARTLCQAEGFVLGRINDGPSASAVRDFITAAGPTARSWLGATDVEQEGAWRWLDNGDNFWNGLADGSAPPGAFADFGAGEPNQFMGNDEDCLSVRETGWNDARCDVLRAALCSEP